MCCVTGTVATTTLRGVLSATAVRLHGQHLLTKMVVSTLLSSEVQKSISLSLSLSLSCLTAVDLGMTFLCLCWRSATEDVFLVCLCMHVKSSSLARCLKNCLWGFRQIYILNALVGYTAASRLQALCDCPPSSAVQGSTILGGSLHTGLRYCQ